ncbi:hypothetical protein K435DRAFT_776658 [Dendrothele bispora CBS 962.96]|uniref:Uncharacterized protein n=1 Tax=Dendrothele bispora (strain CBS 962.96) TaxID=1314807 RepID=A0A4S8KK16_DENBC|nr:hypothetical protein K435DRAFT_787490 [Dendrothele bispora CBS 962.96]THV00310.1 hypothetical protein K435DRAFT_776658 [Dendrothele bispora CBS 962.96]
MSASKLFQPIKLGDISLKHRVVMAPLSPDTAPTRNTYVRPASDHPRNLVDNRSDSHRFARRRVRSHSWNIV